MLQVNSKLRTVLHQDVSVVALFQHPTIYLLAQFNSAGNSQLLKGRATALKSKSRLLTAKKTLLSNQGRKIHE